ncbi:putative transcriptional regulatory protein C1F7,11c [Talaromyces islandicus]|uniref:Putative transcriptional regulatory protein C1F7,11c n=1 Tax=Talaromyces islandicus TaxID=28573 RepID=A0A0U1LW47_TALIS|nr:putative transcriptional regulatory protein C1F7,11c [Talaromyces islandicus]
MSQAPFATLSETGTEVYASPTAPPAVPTAKPRSLPSTDRPPRWARRLKNAVPATDPQVGQVMERLQNLERLVKELTSQLEQAQETANPGSSEANRDQEAGDGISPPTSEEYVHAKFGRLVLQDSNRSRYISSGFWSRVGYELDELKMQTSGLTGQDPDTSDDDVSGENTVNHEITRTPSQRHAFIFGHNLGHFDANSNDFRPLPSQIPFLLDIFSENVNSLLQIVHMPTINQMVRNHRANDNTAFTPANEALMFAIYYSAIVSMDKEDVLMNFGSAKADINCKYRVGLEHALAKADFLNSPDLVLVQAITLFLFLLRLDESPGFVWMMTGLAIRMAQSIGLHRDGTNFQKLKPYDIEMRRRVWWAVCMLDIRASENQGTDMAIANDSFDTKLPLNINDADIKPDSDHPVTEREGITDVFFARISYEMCDLMRQMTSLLVKDGPQDLEKQNHMINELYQIVERNKSKFWTESTRITFAVTSICTRLVMAKMTLLIYHPTLFFSQGENDSEKIRAKLFSSAIEVAEYNHILNAEKHFRQWRWCYLTYTHWYSIVYLVLEISRRPWSPTVERAWVVLHSSWLIPSKFYTDKNMRIWVPLRKLMSRANLHRNAELARLRNDPQAAKQTELEDRKIPMPTSSGPFPEGTDAVGIFLDRWRQLVNMPEYHHRLPAPKAGLSSNIIHPNTSSVLRDMTPACTSNASSETTYYASTGSFDNQNVNSADIMNVEPVLTGYALLPGEGIGISSTQLSILPQDFSFDQTVGDGFVAWPFVDTHSPADLDSEINWYNWIESAKMMEWEALNTLS